jgi:hypothetical protein
LNFSHALTRLRANVVIALCLASFVGERATSRTVTVHAKERHFAERQTAFHAVVARVHPARPPARSAALERLPQSKNRTLNSNFDFALKGVADRVHADRASAQSAVTLGSEL